MKSNIYLLHLLRVFWVKLEHSSASPALVRKIFASSQKLAFKLIQNVPGPVIILRWHVGETSLGQ